MANGQQKAAVNLDIFIAWQATMTDDDFKQIIFRGSLNRGEMAKVCGFGKSALTQNPQIRSALSDLENSLRERNVLPELIANEIQDTSKPREYDNTVNQRIMDSKRVSSLEQENIALKAEVNELKSKLERFGELSETLTEMGMMPR